MVVEDISNRDKCKPSVSGVDDRPAFDIWLGGDMAYTTTSEEGCGCWSSGGTGAHDQVDHVRGSWRGPYETAQSKMHMFITDTIRRMQKAEAGGFIRKSEYRNQIG